MAETRKAQLFELLGEMGGGAVAGLVDIEFPTTLPLGIPVGGLLGGGLALVGVLAGGGSSGSSRNKLATAAADIGGGMLAFEAGSAVAAFRLKQKLAAPQGQAQTAGVAGMLPQNTGVVTQADLLRSLNQLHAMRRG